MESRVEFRFFNWLLTAISYQPPLAAAKRRIFIAYKLLHIVLFAFAVSVFHRHQRQILYDEDSFGEFADVYRFLVSVFTATIIIAEPFVMCRRYSAMHSCRDLFEKSLRKNFGRQQNIRVVYERVNRKIKAGIVVFILCYIFCELIYFYRSIFHTKSRLFYLSFLVPTFIVDLKILQLVFNMELIASYLKVLRCLTRDLNEEIVHNQKLKSSPYDRIIRKKYRELIAMHYSVVKLVDNHNASLGISQMVIMLAMKFYMTGDFYWIAFSLLQKKMVYHESYGGI